MCGDRIILRARAGSVMWTKAPYFCYSVLLVFFSEEVLR